MIYPNPLGVEKKTSVAPEFKLVWFDCYCGHRTTTSNSKFTCDGCGNTYRIGDGYTDGSTPEERYRKALAQIDGWIRMLHTAPRTGAETDDPEGSRVITISDILATNLADCLRELRDTAVKGFLR